MKGKLTTLGGSLWPGRYLTFSCVSLMISVNFLPSIISSYTHIVTLSSKFGSLAAFLPTIFAIAEPLSVIGRTVINNLINLALKEIIVVAKF